jgi:hypothetical protein
MTRKQFIQGFQVLVMAIVLLGVQPIWKGAKAESSLYSGGNQEQLLGASVQISMSVSRPTGKPNSNEVIVTSAFGLGSLIRRQGEAVIITHNHWGELLQDRSQVEIRDAGNGLLLSLTGLEFKALVRSQDEGTLIISAPASLVAPSSKKGAGAGVQEAGNAQEVKPGDVVQVAYRKSGGFNQIELLEAEVTSIGTYKGFSTFNLRSTSGQPVKPGDSGGGIWYNGRLVGNLWGTLMKGNVVAVGDGQPTNQKFTDLSFGAILP